MFEVNGFRISVLLAGAYLRFFKFRNKRVP